MVFYNAYRFNPNRANFAQLEQEVTRREAFLDRLFGKPKQVTDITADIGTGEAPIIVFRDTSGKSREG